MRGRSHQCIKASLLAGVLAWMGLAVGVCPARANPTGPSVKGGSISVSQSGSTETIVQSTQTAVVDWASFNVSQGETTLVQQPSTSALLVSRVKTGAPISIDGTLVANGNLVLIDPNGVLFGAHAVVDVNGLIASTADGDTAEMMLGLGRFALSIPGAPNASILNYGVITARDAGLVGFVAPTVVNAGVITAKLGRVILAGGDVATVDLYGDGLLEVALSGPEGRSLVKNTGSISAQGGAITLTAAQGGALVNRLIVAGGALAPQVVLQRNGVIEIASAPAAIPSGQASAVEVSGTLDASSSTGKGGTVGVFADAVTVGSGARVDASGSTGGGVIEIGGAAHGGFGAPTARTTVVEAGAILDADAVTRGDGGQVVVWSQTATRFAGLAEAEGGALGGDGGFIETSSRGSLAVTGSARANAPLGAAGEWLLDPSDVTIASGTGANLNETSAGGVFTPSTGASTSTIYDANINAALAGGTSVTISTTSTGTGSGAITLASAASISTTTSAGLTLSAAGAIALNGSVSLGSGALVLSAAGGAVSGTGAISTGGGVSITASSGAGTLSGVISGAGGLTLGGSETLTLSGANSYTGATTVNGGTLTAGSTTAFGSGSALSVATGATLDLAGFSLSTASLAGAGTVTNSAGTAILTSGSANTSTTFSGVLHNGAGVLGLTKVGSGTLTLTGTNTLTGGLTVSAGVLMAGSTGAFGSGNALTAASGATADLAGYSLTVASLSGAGTVTDSSTTAVVLTTNGATTTTFSGRLQDGAGNMSLVKAGSGVLTLSGADTYTGSTTISAGKLVAGSTTALGSASVTTVSSGATLDLGGFNLTVGSLAGMGLVTDTGAAASLTIGGANTSTTFGGVLQDGTGALSIVKTGSGAATLAGANLYSGSTTVSAGTLKAGSTTAFGSNSAVTVASGATLDIAGFSVAAGSIAGAGVITDGGAAATLTFGGANTTTTFSGVIQNGAGAVSLTKTGTGSTTLSGADLYTGATTVSAGTLTAGSTTAFGSNSAVTVASGATLDIGGFSVAAGSIAGAGVITDGGAAATLTFGGANTTTTFSGVIQNGAGAVSLTKTGTGSTTLSGANLYSGATTVSAGTLKAGSTTAFGVNTAATVSSGAVLDVGGQTLSVGSLAGSGTVTNSGGAAAVLTEGGSNATTSFSGVIQDGASALGLTKTGSGALTLSGADTYSGATRVNAGTLEFQNEVSLYNDTAAQWTASQIFVSSGAVLAFGFGGAGQFTSADIATLSALGTNTGGFLGGSFIGIDTASGSKTYAGVLADTNGGANSLGLVKLGANTLTLSGANTFSGGASILSGALLAGNASAFGTGALSVASGTTADVSGVNVSVGALTGAGTVKNSSSTAATLTIGVGGGSGTFTGAIQNGTGVLGLTKAGSGAQTLSGTDTFTGATTVSGGTLLMGSTGAFSSSSALVAGSAGTFDLAGFAVTAASLAGSGTVTNSGASAVLSVGGSNASTTFSGVLRNGASALGLTKTGSGTLTLSGANTFTGALTASAGVLQAGSATAFGGGAALVVNAGAVADLAGFSLSIGSLAGSGTVTDSSTTAVTLTTGASNANASFSGVLQDGSGALALVKNGTGQQTLSGANTFSGGVTVNAGMIKTGSTSALGLSPAVVEAAGAQIDLNGNSISIGSLSGAGQITNSNAAAASLTIGGLNTSTTFAGAIVAGTGGVSVTKTGTGSLTLSGADTYAGATLVSAGTLSAGSTSAFGSGSAVTVSSGAALDLGGNNISLGSLAGAGVVVDNGAAAILTVGSNNASTTFSGAIQNGSGTISLTKTGSGQLTLSGANTYTGVTRVTSGTLDEGTPASLYNDVVANWTATNIIVSSGAVLAFAYGGSGFSASDIQTLSAIGSSTGGFLSGSYIGFDTTAGSQTYASVIADTNGGANAVGVAKLGPNALTLSGANTYTGSAQVYGGSLIAGSPTALGVGIVSIASGAVLDLAGNTVAVGGLTGGGTVTSTSAAGGTLTMGSSNTSQTFSGVIQNGAGEVNIIKVGTGTETLSGANTYTGTTTVSGGTLALATESALYNGATSSWTAANITVGSGATLALSYGGAGQFTSADLAILTALGSNTGGFLSGSTIGIDTTSGNRSYAGAIGDTNGGANAVGLKKLGANTLTLSGAETYSGATTVAAGSLAITGSWAPAGATGLIATAAGTSFSASGPVTASTLSLSGAGAFSLTGANVVSNLASTGGVGAVTVNDTGALSVSSITSTGAIVISTTGDITLSSGAALRSTASGDAVVLAAGGNFLNNAGSGAVVAANGDWLIYSNQPSSDTFGGLNSNQTALWGSTYVTRPPVNVTQAGNRYIFQYQPTLTITTTSDTKTYGVDYTATVANDYTITGFQPALSGVYLADTATSAVTGAPAVTSAGSAATAAVAGGPYSVAATVGTLASPSGYAFNYAGTGTLTVTPAPLIVTAANATMNYGASSLPTFGAIYTGFVNGETAAALTTGPSFATGAVAYTGVPGSGSNAGSYTITPSGVVDSNYAITYATGTLTVAKVALTITPSSPSMTYGGAVLPTLTAAYAGLVNGDTAASLTTGPTLATTATAYNGTAGSGSAAGTYATTASGAVDPNYTITYATGTLTVTQAPLTITGNSPSVVYGASSLPTLTATYAGFVNGDTPASLTTAATLGTGATAYNGTAGSGSPVGAYAVTPSGAVDPNYAITYVAGALTVGKAPLTVTASPATMTYGAGALPTLLATYSGLVNGDTASNFTTGPTFASGATAYNGTAGSGSAVGTYTITPSGVVDPNYTISYATGTLSVTKAPLTITPNSPSMTYGASSLPTLTAGYSGLVNGDTSLSLTTAPTLSTTASAFNGTAGSGSAVGSYTVTASGAVDPNYTITYATGTLAVTKAPLTITGSSPTTTYGFMMLPTLTASYSGLVNGDTTSSLSTAPSLSTTATAYNGTPGSGSNAGAYAVTPSGAVDPNYTITYVAGTLTVNPAPLTVTAAPATMVYGAGALPTLGATYAGLVNGDTASNFTAGPTLATTATAYNGTPGSGSSVGSYAITASGLVDPNYTVTYATGTLAVTKAPLTITGSSPTTTYGFMTLPTLTASYSGLVNGDTSSSLSAAPSLSTTATAYNGTPGSGSNAGAYAVTPSGAVDPNYTITYLAGTLTVNPAPLTVTAAPATMVYGAGALPTLGATYAGLVNGDTASNFTAGPTLATTATAYNGTPGSGSSVGSYAITASGLVDPNYTVTYASGSLSVTKAPLTITPDNVSMTYGASSLPTLTAGYSGLVNGDTVASLTTGPTFSTTATVYNGTAGSGSSVGSYALTASGAVDPNYSITYATGTLAVTKASLTITGDGATMTYGASSLPSLTATYAGLVNGDTPSNLTTLPSLTTSATVYNGTPGSGSSAGVYDVVPSGAVDPNYTITYVPGALTVTPAALTVTALPASMTYGSSALPGLAASYVGFANGDTAASLTTLATLSTTASVFNGAPGSGSAAGAYAITAAGVVDPNYTVSYVPGVLTVAKASLTITPADVTTTYGAGAPALTATYAGFVNGDTAASLVSAPNISTMATFYNGTPGSGSPVGVYAIAASGAIDPNYTIGYGSGVLTVTPAPLTITGSSPTTTYGFMTLPTLTASYSGLVNGDTTSSLSTAPSLSTTATAYNGTPGSGSNAGAYAVTPSGAVDPNYTITYVAGTLTVNPAPLTVTASPATMVYGAGALPTLGATYAGLVNGDTASNFTAGPTLATTATAYNGTAGSGSNAGSYGITASGIIDPNYVVTYASGTLTVSKAPLTITADNTATTYGFMTLPTLTASYSGLVNGDTTSSLSTAPSLSTTATAYNGTPGSGSNAGAYAVTPSGAVDPNYTITYVAGTLTVNPAPLTVTASPATMVYGAGALPTLGATYAGLVNGDTASNFTAGPTLATTATAYNGTPGSGSSVGSYAITASGLVDPNYTVTYASGSLSVTKAPLTITPDNVSMTYGASSLPTLTAGYSGLVNGDTVASLTTGPTFSTTATVYNGTAGSGSSVGSYALTASGAVDPNYSITYASGTLAVTKAPLTITGDNTATTYGFVALPTLTASYSGLVNGDTSSSLSTAPALSTTATAYNGMAGSGSNAGSYAVTPSGAVDPNYTITYVAGTLTVNPAPLTVTASPATMVYGAGALPTLGATYAGLVNGDTASNFTAGPTLATTATAYNGTPGSGSSVGSYAITASGLVDPNYTVTYASGSLSVTPAPLVVSGSSATMTYGASALPTLAASYAGFVNGDTAANLSTLANVSTIATAFNGSPGSGSNAGAYAVLVSGAADPNYAITYVSGVLTVAKAPLTITANDAATTYGAASLPTFSGAYSGLVNGDAPSSLTTGPSYITSATAYNGTPGSGSNAGTYLITPEGAISNNYNITYATGTLTIAKAPLVIAAGDAVMTYGSSAYPAFAPTYAGLVNGDTPLSLTAPIFMTTASLFNGAAGSGSHVGTYPLDVSGGGSSNYTATYVQGTLTVAPAPLSVVGDNATMVFGATALPNLTASYVGLVNGDTPSNLTTQATLSTTATPFGSLAGPASPVGLYPVIASGALDPDYTIVFVPGVLTIGAPQTVPEAFVIQSQTEPAGLKAMKSCGNSRQWSDDTGACAGG